jgi:hypothetical protein
LQCGPDQDRGGPSGRVDAHIFEFNAGEMRGEAALFPATYRSIEVKQLEFRHIEGQVLAPSGVDARQRKFGVALRLFEVGKVAAAGVACRL